MLVAARIIQELGHKAMIFVVTEEAVRDTYEEFCEAIVGAKIGRWSGSKKEVGDITVCTIQSLYEKNRGGAKELFEAFKECDVVIFDEVHATGAYEYYNIAKLSHAFYKFGQSGTPFRGDGKDILLQAATGRIIYKKTTKELQEMGYLAESKVLFFKTKMPSDQTHETLAELQPHDKYRATIIENDHRNALIKAVFKKYANQPTLVIVKSQDHLKFLSDYLGIPLVYGKSSKGYRKAVQDQLRSGEMWAVVATKVYDQSVNIPALKIAINCAGHSPKNAQIQRLGRILRQSGGNGALFIDFWDEFNESPLVHSKNRLDYLKEEGHDIEVLDMNYKLDITPEDIKKYRPVKEEKEETEEFMEDDYEYEDV
jgi:DNA excision repair protein ERCC-3